MSFNNGSGLKNLIRSIAFVAMVLGVIWATFFAGGVLYMAWGFVMLLAYMGIHEWLSPAKADPNQWRRVFLTRLMSVWIGAQLVEIVAQTIGQMMDHDW